MINFVQFAFAKILRFFIGGKNEKQIWLYGGVLTTLLFTLLFSLSSCDNGSTSSPSENDSGIDTSLGTPPDETLKIPDSDITVKKDCADGIFLEFPIPEKTSQYRVHIDGIGQVAESVWFNDERTKGAFFYPFVTPGKEYTLRFAFYSKEIERDGWNYGGGECVGWFDATVKAGSRSKGEVRLLSKGAVSVKSNGEFKFTERPSFQNENVMNGDWNMIVALVEGVSWEHGDDRKTKWRGELNIPSAELTKTINLYLYNENGSWRNGGEWEIDFLCIRPRMEYTYDSKKYTYQWDNLLHETPLLDTGSGLWKVIDLEKADDVEKIKGTWKHEEQWERWYDDEKTLKVKIVYEETLVIETANVTETDVWTYTKPDGDAFTETEKGNWRFEKYESDDGSYSESTEISSDNKTITEEYSSKKHISKYFENEDDGNYSRHYTVKLFENGSTLRIIRSGTDDGEKYEWWNDYKKVK